MRPQARSDYLSQDARNYPCATPHKRISTILYRHPMTVRAQPYRHIPRHYNSPRGLCTLSRNTRLSGRRSLRGKNAGGPSQISPQHPGYSRNCPDGQSVRIPRRKRNKSPRHSPDCSGTRWCEQAPWNCICLSPRILYGSRKQTRICGRAGTDCICRVRGE